MAGRRLSAEEGALWARVTATVRALGERAGVVTQVPPPAPPPPLKLSPTIAAKPSPPPRPIRLAAASPADTLDGGWDRRLRRGLAAPDRSIDLHGHTVASAHDALDQALDRAVADDVRLLLVVTGRPPRPDGEGRRRGLIRAAIGDWLAISRHASRIAAVRNAHPRHGGAGALYIVFSRRREPGR